MSTKKDMEDFVEKLSDPVRRNVSITSAKDCKKPFMLHISVARGKEYVPRIGHRQMDYEDRTVPRVTVSPHLLGCISGYSSVIRDTQEGCDDWRGGYYINRLNFDYCLKPTRKLVYDEPCSDEHWLIAEGIDGGIYTGEVIGKFFAKEFKFQPVIGDSGVFSPVCYLELSEEICFDNDRVLQAGFYCFSYNCFWSRVGQKIESVTIDTISFAEYKRAKALVTVNLAADNKKSVVARWE